MFLMVVAALAGAVGYRESESVRNVVDMTTSSAKQLAKWVGKQF